MVTDHPQPQKSLQIKQDDKFFSRLMSKETSLTNPSFRVYYGVASAGSVPFVWESQPGTPKNKFCDTYIPPLTPPPSYHVNSKTNPIKKASKFNLMHSIFPKLNVKKSSTMTTTSSTSPSSSMSSFSWSSSLSSPSSFPSKFYRRLSSSRSSFDSRVDDDEEQRHGSPTSTLCFGGGGFRGCNSMGIMKNALSSIVGHGSGQGNENLAGVGSWLLMEVGIGVYEAKRKIDTGSYLSIKFDREDEREEEEIVGLFYATGGRRTGGHTCGVCYGQHENEASDVLLNTPLCLHL